MIAYDKALYQDAIVRDLCDLIAVPTVNNGRPEPGKPFGEDVARGFGWVRAKAAEFGFDVTEFDGYALQVDVGTGEHVVGMLCHTDVVPAGDGWETNPFEGVVRDGKVFGRGTVDDKGPLVCCFYAAKYLRDNGLIPANTRLRIVVGGDEEVGWQDITYYSAHAEAPEIAFAADGMFPLIFGEKGLIDFDFVWPLERDAASPVQLVALEGGVARNSVPTSSRVELLARGDVSVVDLAAELREAAAEQDIKADITAAGNTVTIAVRGKGAHAMFPDRGVNAVTHALALLVALGDRLDVHQFVSSFEQIIADDHTGALLGVAMSDEASGPLTFNVGQIALEGNTVRVVAGIRYPISADYDVIVAQVTKAGAEAGATYELVEHMNPIYFHRDDEVVQLLWKAYRDVTGDTVSEPFTVGAATFARTMKNTVAFGPIFPGQVEMSHLPNEFISIDDLNTCTEIYINALVNLVNRPEIQQGK